MAISNLLGIARSALLTHQRSMDVAGHNIANAETPGYTRQRLTQVAAEPMRTPLGLLGRGVTDQGVARTRDRFLDAGLRREQGGLGRSTTLREFLSQVEGAVNEPSTSGISAALDDLFGAFGDLANDPSSTVNRSLVQDSARQLVARVRQLDSRVVQLAADAAERMDAMVADANTIAKEIAALNVHILEAGGPNRSASDLQDRRDLLIDQLSDLVSVRVLERPDGVKSVLAGDTLLVDGAQAQVLVKAPVTGGGFGLALQGGTPVNPQSGQLKALAELTTTVLPGIRTGLDNVVQSIVTEFNAIHRTGFTVAGVTNTDFFDPAGMTAGTFALAAAVDASGDAIAAAAVVNAPGDGSIALRMAGLRTTPVVAGRTLADLYAQVAADVGTRVRLADQDVASQGALVDNFETQRASVSGVSIDEEMVTVIATQQAYAAAARLISVADEMLRDLLEMV